MTEADHQKRVVVVGAGFGGLNAARRLSGQGFDLIKRASPNVIHNPKQSAIVRTGKI